MATVEESVDEKAVEELKKEAELFKEKRKNNLFDFRVYDCENEVINDAIAISRLHFHNRVADFIKWAVAVWKGQNSETEEMFGTILLELQKLNHKDEPVEKTEKIIKTFG